MRCVYGILLLTLISGVGNSLAATADRVLDIRDYGATPDGKTICTAAIQKAIDQCAARGGGTVCFPPGVWLSGTIELRSNVTLRLEAGSRLLGSPKPADYPGWVPEVGPSTSSRNWQSLIRGINLKDVAICGRGTIDGQGKAFSWKENENRPFAIRLINCRDVLVEGVSLCNSGQWMQHYLACQRVRIHGITVNNHATYNNDGLDLDGCRDVVISDCTINSDDDGIVLKSTGKRPCENVAVSNCVVASHCNALKLGTESCGGFRNITIANCAVSSPVGTKAIYGIDRGMGGVALELVDGGVLENVTVSNVAIDGVAAPIFLRLGNRGRPAAKDSPKPGVGTFRNVVVSNIVATRASTTGCSITGIPGHPVENVQLSNIQISFDGGGKATHALAKVPEYEEKYPESRMFGILPAYGFYCRHATGLKLRDVRLRTEQPDLRAAIAAEDVKGLVIDGLDVPPGAAGAAATVRLIDCPKAAVRCTGDVQTETTATQPKGTPTP
jgi:polygalacturonase